MPASPRLPIVGLLLLTTATGVVDAASYLALDRVFTGNMTGNILFLGFAAVDVGGVPLLNNLIALAGFVLGSAAGGRIVGRGHPDPRLTGRGRSVLLAGLALLIALSVLWWLAGDPPLTVKLVITGLLAIVMGAQVSAVKPLGNSDVTTIVVTNTIANLSRDSRLAGGRGQRWVQRLLAILCMALGAAIGALAVAFSGGPAALAVASVLYAAALLPLHFSRSR